MIEKLTYLFEKIKTYKTQLKKIPSINLIYDNEEKSFIKYSDLKIYYIDEIQVFTADTFLNTCYSFEELILILKKYE